MKIVWVLGLAFLATGTAHSVPAEEQKTTNEQVEDGDKVEADNMALSEEEDEDSSDDEDPAIAAEDQSDEIAADQDSNLMDMAEYQKEINAYLEQEKATTYGMRVRRQNGKRVIRSGNTIALQTFVKDQYFSCAGRVCGRSSCPRAHMDKNDWNRCTGEVFRIYRKSGPGAAQVHDLVGLGN